MKETKFYIFFMIYIIVLTTIGIMAFEYVISLAQNIKSYTLGITIVIPLLIIILFIAIIIATRLAFITSFKKDDKISEILIKSFKFMLEGIGIIIIFIPIYFIVENTRWVIQTGEMNLDLIIGEIIVSSLILIGGICVLSQTYVTLKATADKQNVRISSKKVN